MNDAAQKNPLRLVDVSGAEHPASQSRPTTNSRYSSEVRVSRPLVMLIRIDPGEEPPELDLSRLPVRVVRVRHPLPACVRIRALRPHIVIVGATVVPAFLPELVRAVSEVGATLIDAVMPGKEGLRPTLVNAIQSAMAAKTSGVASSAQ